MVSLHRRWLSSLFLWALSFPSDSIVTSKQTTMSLSKTKWNICALFFSWVKLIWLHRSCGVCPDYWLPTFPYIKQRCYQPIHGNWCDSHLFLDHDFDYVGIFGSQKRLCFRLTVLETLMFSLHGFGNVGAFSSWFRWCMCYHLMVSAILLF